MTDKKGYQAFCKEIMTLSNLDHINIIKLVGYTLDPCLLIIMEFVGGGTLASFVKAQDFSDPPSPESLTRILIGCAEGMEYLHGREPMPILHRDMKSENILLTKELEARIADLGEARTLSKDRAMTIVGSNGYTAPEVLRGEQYVI